MIERMEKAYTDVTYICPEVVSEYESADGKQVNVSSATLVIKVINKLYDLAITYGADVLDKNAHNPDF